MSPPAGFDHIFNVIDGIGGASILRERIIIVIWLACLLIQHYIFIDRAKAHGIPDLRLIFLRQVDALRVTTALEVEDTIITPAMLIITDQAAARIGRKTCLPRTRQAKEERH